MVQSADTLTQSLRTKTDPVLGAYARLLAARDAAQRVHRLAFSAAEAYRTHSPDEARQALHAVDFATDQVSEHVQHALIALDAERAS